MSVLLRPLSPPTDVVPWDNEADSPTHAVVTQCGTKVVGLFSDYYWAKRFANSVNITLTIREVAS